jgi:hypothetical protein
MFKTDSTVGTLKTIAMVAGLAITLWSLGLPYLQFAGAAALTDVSDTLSTSEPGVPSDHTIEFTITTAVPAGGTITVTFDDDFDLTGVGVADIDLIDDSSSLTLAGAPSGATWGVDITGQVITFESGTGEIATSSVMEVLIGTNADGGANQIENPATPDVAYDVFIDTSAGDTGATKVAIVSAVEVTATVNTILDFTVAGVAAGQTVNGTTTTGVATATEIPFGLLDQGIATTTAQDLTVTTNASAGYVVTVQLDGYLRSQTGNFIYGFNNGSDTDTPAGWATPTGTLATESTWAHWGVTSDDLDAGRGSEFTSGSYIAASTSPRIVMGHDSVADGSTAGIGAARVGYTIQVSGLQPAGDYEAQLIYVATPTF